MRPIFLLRLHDHLKSLRFQVSLAILLLFFAANGFVYALKVDRVVEELGRIQADNESAYTEVGTLADAVDERFSVATRPLGTEFMAEGGQNWLDDSFRVSAETCEGAPDAGRRQTLNNWLEPYEMVDWVLIVRLVLSFLCVVLAYDSVSADLDSGLLRQALANPITRGRYLAGRLLADSAVVLVSLVCGTLVSLLILTASGAIEISAGLLGSYGLFLVASTLYAVTFLLLAMGVSALARSSSTALVTLLLAWALFVVVVPQAAYLLGVDPAQRRGAFYDQEWEHRRQVEQALEREGISLRSWDLGRPDGFADEREYARRLQEAEGVMDGLRREMYAQEARQFRQARARALVSPGAAYQYTVEALLGTGVPKVEHLFEQVWQYRDDLREFFRARDASDPESPHILFLPWYMSQRPLEAADIPRFSERHLRLADSIGRQLDAVLILIVEAGLAFLFAFWAFRRLDLTG